MGVTNQAPHTENPETSSYKSKKEQREAGPRMGTAQPEQQEGMVGVMGTGMGTGLPSSGHCMGFTHRCGSYG